MLSLSGLFWTHPGKDGGLAVAGEGLGRVVHDAAVVVADAEGVRRAATRFLEIALATCGSDSI